MLLQSVQIHFWTWTELFFVRRSSKGVSFAPKVATVMNGDKISGGENGACYRDGDRQS